jgi:hypothetical protein
MTRYTTVRHENGDWLVIDTPHTRNATPKVLCTCRGANGVFNAERIATALEDLEVTPTSEIFTKGVNSPPELDRRK